MPRINPDEAGLDVVKLNVIDSIAIDAIEKKAIPGCVILVAKDGKIVYNKAFGYFNYDKKEAVTTTSIYDLASVTKICATTISIMKLYDEGKINLKNKLGGYLPWVKGTNKENLLIENILLHQAGLAPLIWFYKETMDANGNPYTKYYSSTSSDSFNIRVAQNLFLRSDWKDTMYKRIVESPLTKTGKYVYSDIDFILLGKVVEAVSGLPLDEYVQKEFYKPLGLNSTGFHPLNYDSINRIAPTEQEKGFRNQLIRGDVHDPGAAMFGGVSGHAGLFSDASDLVVLMQMLLNGGELGGKQYLQKKTIELFTAYHSAVSRRGYGFDKPEKDNATRIEPYPCKSASPLTFGHTGFTGTCVWVDPRYNLIYIFLSNRVTPESDNEKLVKMNVRSKIEEVIYNAGMTDFLNK